MNFATITNKNHYTIFKFNDKTIQFKTPGSLEYYSEIKKWDNGYIVAMAKYTHNKNLEEEYIDLIPILNNLYIDAEEFLKPIKKVVIQND